MRHLALLSCVTLAIAFDAIRIEAQQTPAFVGQWRGDIVIAPPRGSRELSAQRATRLPTSLEITRSADGSYAVRQINMSRGNQEIPVTTVTVQGEAITWSAPSVKGSYEGRLSKDGNKILGTWTQFGSANRLNFDRVAK